MTTVSNNDEQLNTLIVEEGYYPPINATGQYKFKTPDLLNKASFKEAMVYRTNQLVWYGGMVTLLLIVAASTILLPPLPAIGVFFITVFAGIQLTKKVIRVTRVASFQAAKQRYSFGHLEGWFPDPWSNGVPNQKRLFQNGQWTDHTRIEG